MRALILVHRYLGIAVGWLILVWCLSGIVMMYVGFPEVTPAERLRLLPTLNLDGCCEVDPYFGGIAVAGAAIEMLGDRPVLRVTDDAGRRYTLALDDGSYLDTIRAETAAAAGTVMARTVAGARPVPAGEIVSDQWTVTGNFNAHRPLHVIEVGDEAGTRWYLSSASGELVQAATRAERFWSWLGAVPHWLYPKLLREKGALWIRTVIVTSLVALFLTLAGLYIGVSRLRWRTEAARSPYRGTALWHHWLGLLFGLLGLTWLGSGLLSVNPWGLLESRGAAVEQARLAGPALDFARVKAWVRDIVAAGAPDGAVRLELLSFGGSTTTIAFDSAGGRQRLDAATLAPRPLTASDLTAAAERLADSRPIASAEWIEAGDAYYFDHHATRSYPAYRIVLADRARTRFYLDAVSGELRAMIDAPRRHYRWWFEGLHRLDFTQTMRTRPLWDAVMIALLGGLSFVAGTGTYMGVRYLLRTTRRRDRRHPVG